MKQPRLTRRQFFKASAFGAGALALPAIGLASVAAAPSREAQAAAEQPLAPAIPQPTFNPIASNTTFGPLTDISMGWDGTVWGIDAQGAPHVYDSINDVWQQHGDGIDAAALSVVSATQQTLYIFQGSNVVAVDALTLKASPPTTIAALWPDLPDSFKLGVSGAIAAPNGSGLILFNGGRYVSTDGSVPLGKLTDLRNWPQSPTWKDGVIDGAISSGPVYLMRGDQILPINMENKSVDASFPLSVLTLTTPIPLDWAKSGIDAWAPLTLESGTNLIFKGTAVLSYNIHTRVPAPLSYLGNVFSNWPPTWHPVLAHAPNGRDGNLWSVLPIAQGGWIVQHNGDVWTQLPNQADHAGVGQDNTVMIAGAQKLWSVVPKSDNTGYNVTPVSAANNLIQVSLGNANAVYARDSSGNVYSFDPGSGALTPNAALGAVAHIATTNDGTLWHAKPNDSNIHRLLTTAPVPSQAIQVKQTLVTAVTKVAATGFGASHCLAQDNNGQTQAYRYDSPYLFKSPQDYYTTFYYGGQMAQGLGNLYFGNFLSNQLVALDAHTGVELSRSAPASTYVYWLYTNPVVDTANELVYVATYVNYSDAGNPFGDVTTPQQVLALSARDLSKVVWTFTTAASVNVAPSLVGTTLLFGDRAGTIYAIDTTAAAQAAAKNTGSSPIGVSAKATWKLNQLSGLPGVPAGNGIPQGGFATFAPAIGYNGQYFLSLCLTYNYTATLPFYVLYFYSVLLDPATQGQATYDAIGFHGSGQHYSVLDLPPWWNQIAPPISRSLTLPVGNETVVDMIFLACDDAVVQLSPAPNNAFNATTLYTLPTGSAIQGGLALDASDGGENVKLWFGDQNGYLHGIDTGGNPQPHTPALIAPNSRIAATPLPYIDPRGVKTIYAGAMQRLDAGYLYGFDPVGGNINSLETGTLQITLMTPAVTHGMVYVAGLYLAVDNIPKRTQVMGIRLDTLSQGLRDFVIESQLMQDPDETATDSGSTDSDNPIPPSVARYQTHLTLVDDQKNPLSSETVKIWADVAGTVIVVSGKQYTIGPDDDAFAQVTTGADGSLVIMSDAKDVNASGLRVWAPFMDPYERIVVYPDQEWHARASNSYDDPNADPTKAPDPSKPNLSTAHSYSPDPKAPGTTAPKQLFNTDEKSQGAPGNVANAIGQMRSGLNPGGNSAASVAGALKTLHGSNPAAPYIAYTDLGGMHYGPNNARAKRTAAIAAPVGFALYRPQDGSTHTYTPMSHSDARSAIDALTGTPWDPKNPNGTAASSDKPLTFVIRRSDNLFTDFWNWLKGVGAAIENIVVSVADDIMVGIKFIVDNVEKVFKAIIQVVEDIVNAIGSFFLQLAKLIEEIIEALSVLFHFGEIIWFHNWLKGLINHEVNGIKDAIINNVKNPFDSFIGSTEDAIKAQFDQWRAKITGQGINDMQGGKSTAHSAFTIKDSNGNSSSQSVVAGANVQKMKGTLSPGNDGSSNNKTAAQNAVQGAPKSVQDAISDFFTNFSNRISGDGDLSAAFSQLKSDFSNLFNSSSGSQFASSALTALLDLLETVLIALLSVCGAFFDGLVGVIEDLITGVLGFMNTQLDIPFFSWLYKLVFGSELTLLDLIALVASIPGTMIFRVAMGVYPSQAGLPDPNSLPNGSTPAGQGTTQRTGGFRPQKADLDLLGLLKAALGVFNGICIIALGIVSAFSDTFDDGELPSWIGKAGFVLGIIISALSVPAIYSDLSKIGTFDWASYGVAAFIALTSGIGLFLTSPASAKILSVVLAFWNACCLAYIIYAYIDDKATDTAALFGFIGNIFSVLPGMINPAKYLGAVGKAIAIFADVAFNLGWGAVTIAAAFSFLASAERRVYRLHFPFVSHNRAVVQTHPMALAGVTP